MRWYVASMLQGPESKESFILHPSPLKENNYHHKRQIVKPSLDFVVTNATAMGVH